VDTQTPDVFNTFVHVTDLAGLNHAFGPGDPIPGWARPLVGAHVIATGPVLTPGLWDDAEPELIAQAPGVTVFGDDVEGSTERPKPPPVSRPGSNRPAWAEFAKTVGQPVSTAMSRQDIIDALIRNGHLSD
jgi:hypothetical protein